MKILNKIPDPIIWEYDDSAGPRFDFHDFFFTHDDRWEYVDEIEHADIVPLLPPTHIDNLLNSKIRIRDDQIGWIMHFYSIDDHMNKEYSTQLLKSYSIIGKNIVLAHKNSGLKQLDEPNIFYYDSMFDLCKLHFIDYKDETLKNKLWTLHVNQDVYNLPEIAIRPMKKFIYASFIYPPLEHPRMKYRHLLYEFLKDYEDCGYIGSANNRLMPNNPTRGMIEKIDNGHIQWYPLADEYYQNTYLSIVVETIIGIDKNTSSMTDTRCITEKTLEPLVKGNFVLPFGYPGLIKDLIKYGFRFPDWIDYSYDDIKDPNLRFQKFLKSVKNVLSVPIDEIMNVYYYRDRIQILAHNRQVFFDRPYDDLYSKLKYVVDNLPR